MRRIAPVLITCLMLTLFAMPTPPTRAQEPTCFAETGYCVSGPVLAYWQQNGGLPIFGYPITEQRTETVEGRELQVQWFERDRLEIQPDGTVTAGRLGARLLELRGTPWFGFPLPAEGLSADCVLFSETQHSLCPPLRGYWERNGGLDRFGYPITEPLDETIDGQTYTVQYFERRRMEIHPTASGSDILLGLLGREVLNLEQQLAGPLPEPTTPPLPPPSFDNCMEDPDPALAPNYPVAIVNINKQTETETVTLQNVSPEPVNLTGWRMCSIRGNQEHVGIDGILSAGETREYQYTGPDSIWNNDEDDDGALYNDQGQLVSYWDDRP
ncbi:MAG: lamin tail domain-containing protein [Chloroflexaceae bacterium]|nr:lamin tail domain-containing protein [Chloroflexaceae bacterium]